MENKRLTRKLNSIFWWVLMSMPLWALLFGFISVIKLSNNDVVLSQWVDDYGYDSVYSIIQSEEWFNSNAIADFMRNSSISSLRLMFNELFTVIGVSYSNWSIFFANCLAWCLSVKIYHLIFDFLAFLFDWLHDFFERG